MLVTDNMTVSERIFRAHLNGGAFRSGVARGYWRLVSVTWPRAIIALAAAQRKNSPGEYCLNVELSNYPADAPTAQLWDAEGDRPYPRDRWPQGGGRFEKAFRTDWEGGTALYLPCDRRGLSTHDSWRAEHPALVWNSTHDITFFLDIVHELLNSPDYHGGKL